APPPAPPARLPRLCSARTFCFASPTLPPKPYGVPSSIVARPSSHGPSVTRRHSDYVVPIGKVAKKAEGREARGKWAYYALQSGMSILYFEPPGKRWPPYSFSIEKGKWCR